MGTTTRITRETRRMSRPPSTDNSPSAQAFRRAAVANWHCPKCGAPKGFGCKAKNGGGYNPSYNVHGTRLIRAGAQLSEEKPKG
jgi:ribosomal protein L37AE/L43A